MHASTFHADMNDFRDLSFLFRRAAMNDSVMVGYQWRGACETL